MLGFYPSAAHSYYSARPLYSDDIIPLQPPTSDYLYLPRTTDPESHYRRALADYLVAEEELFRAREEASLRARVEALQRQEEARLLQARIIRARKERQAQQLERVLALAQERAAALAARMAIPEGHFSLPRMVPVACSIPERSVLAEQIPRTCVASTEGSRLVPFRASGQGQPEHKTTPHPVPEHGTPVPSSEHLLRAHLRKIASDNEDEEVRDLARAALHHIARHTPERDATNDTSALSHKVSFHLHVSQSLTMGLSPPRVPGDLSRSDALQGAAAEAAKASFKAHRAAVAEQAASPTSISPLETIQDIRTTLSKLSADFSIPPSLDFSDDEADGLAYTPTNAPIRAYEHALEGLLAQLDAVESDGDEEVRVARRAVVKEVETALDGVEKKVKRAREVAEDNSRTGEDGLAEATVSSSDLLEDEDEDEEEDSTSIPAAAGYSSFAPPSAPEVDVVTSAADSCRHISPESAEVVTAPRSPIKTGHSPRRGRSRLSSDVPQSTYGTSTEQLIPANEPPVFATSETREKAASLSPEGFTLTSTPVSPEFLPPALLEDVSALRIPSSLDSEGKGEGGDEADNEDEWSEVEA
ncbi:hypothetical protein EDB87DRAFT_1636875 [Lactarius vividus]|nr:hypothetical protein EDB87DRAFT_1636875 [Lactarius vividus]